MSNKKIVTSEKELRTLAAVAFAEVTHETHMSDSERGEFAKRAVDMMGKITDHLTGRKRFDSDIVLYSTTCAMVNDLFADMLCALSGITEE